MWSPNDGRGATLWSPNNTEAEWLDKAGSVDKQGERYTGRGNSLGREEHARRRRTARVFVVRGDNSGLETWRPGDACACKRGSCTTMVERERFLAGATRSMGHADSSMACVAEAPCRPAAGARKLTCVASNSHGARAACSLPAADPAISGGAMRLLAAQCKSST